MFQTYFVSHKGHEEYNGNKAESKS